MTCKIPVVVQVELQFGQGILSVTYLALVNCEIWRYFLSRDGQVQNGCVCVKCKTSFMKTEAEEYKELIDKTPSLLFCCEIYSIVSVNFS